MNVLIILGVLFVALVVLIPLIEKSNVRFSEQQTNKIWRWVWPLVMILLIVQLLMMAF